MVYPFDPVSALSKANLDLSLRLAEIARHGSQKSFQAATAVASALGEAAQPESSSERKAAALSEKGSGLFHEAQTIREQMVADTRTAFETWQDAWSTASALPDEAKATEAFTDMLRFWQGVRTTVPSPDKRQ
jgi:hypothetical protein